MDAPPATTTRTEADYAARVMTLESQLLDQRANFAAVKADYESARLQAEAERELGADFDQKTFHDTILRLGSVPLPVLEEEVRAFIARQKAGASSD